MARVARRYPRRGEQPEKTGPVARVREDYGRARVGEVPLRGGTRKGKLISIIAIFSLKGERGVGLTFVKPCRRWLGGKGGSRL